MGNDFEKGISHRGMVRNPLRHDSPSYYGRIVIVGTAGCSRYHLECYPGQITVLADAGTSDRRGLFGDCDRRARLVRAASVYLSQVA